MTQSALLVFARAAGMIARAPGFAHPSVPPTVRAGIAAALAFAVAPVAGGGRTLPLPAFVLALVGEVCVGAAIGLGASLLYDGAFFAGRAIDEYVGVRGSVPGANVTNAQAFGRLWSSVFLAAFVLLDGWVPVVRAFAASFAHVPLGAFVGQDAWMRYALDLPRTVVRAAVPIAAPPLAVAATLQLALGAVTRVVPRFGSLSIAFPAVFAAVLVVTLLTVPLLAPLGARPLLPVPW